MEKLKNQIAYFLKRYSKTDKPLLVLLGPTASGKTALSLEIAAEYNGEIISADSRQVYTYMDIGTDKILEPERRGIPHFLIDVTSPTERFTVADFKRLAEAKIEEILGRGKLPVLCGGTGLYIRSITENFDIPAENLEKRGELKKELDEKGSEALHEKLAQLDPENAAKISPKNGRYILRALEIFYATGQPKHAARLPSPYRILQIGLAPAREVLFERIHRRVDRQLERGLVEEVKSLLDKGFSPELPALQTLGYREIIAFLKGKGSLAAASELIKKNTRNFAKRQMTWFKKDKDVIILS